MAEKAPFSEVISLFYHAIHLDTATSCYILLIPFIFLFSNSFIQKKWIDYGNLSYTFLIILLYTLINTGEIGVYSEWKTKLDYKALAYLRHPQEVADTASTFVTILLVIILALQTGISFYAYKRWFYPMFKPFKTAMLWKLVFFVIFPPLLFLGLRGGVQQIPINQAESYYSKHNILNLIAVNSGFNLYKSYLENKDFMKENPFGFFSLAQAKATVNQLHDVEKDTTISILKIPHPNIVLILLESWSGDLIESLGGEPGITPQFRELEKQGLLFTNLYSSGNRSQQAMAAVFGGFPSIPVTAITHNSNKFIKLPSLSKELNKAGYNTSYYFGGQLIYGELRAYIMFNEFKRIIEGKDFDPSIPQGKLGVHDQYLFARQLNDLKNEKEPFFSAEFTLSSHSPYDQPMDKVLTWGGDENQFINSAYYTDKCLGDYFREARKQKWYKNTLFILVADHSHNSYRNWGVNTPPYRKIPLMFYGDALKDEFKGKQIKRISSQTDLACTLLKQLNLDASSFTWSKNLFNPYTPEFAYFEINVGCGWIRPDGQFVYQNTTKSFDQNTFPPGLKETRTKEGKSYLQVLFQQFMDY